MVYYDACLMSMLKNLCGLAEVADYAMGAALVTPCLGGDYASLIGNRRTGANLETAMKQYCREVMAHWNVYGAALGISLTDLSKLAPVTAGLRKISEELVASYDHYAETYDDATNTCYRLDPDYPFFDVMVYVQKLAVDSEMRSSSTSPRNFIGRRTPQPSAKRPRNSSPGRR